MKISRSGAHRDRGYAETQVPLTVGLQTAEPNVLIYAKDVPDFSTSAQHNWTIELSVEEIATLVQWAADKPDAESLARVGAALRPALVSLLRLATAAAESMRQTGLPQS